MQKASSLGTEKASGKIWKGWRMDGCIHAGEEGGGRGLAGLRGTVLNL